MAKTYEIGGKTFTLAEPKNRRMLKFVKILGAKTLTDIVGIVGKTEDEQRAKGEALVFDLIVDDTKLFAVLSVALQEPLAESTVAEFDNIELFGKILTDFFSQYAESSSTPLNA